MLNWLFGKSLESYIGQTKKIRVAGIRFEIKKVNALNYVDGTNSIRQTFDTYKTSKEQIGAMLSDKKVIDHLKSVICGCTVHPRIVHKKEEEGVLVDDLFVNMELVLSLYNEIMFYTYGKKKILKLASQKKDF